MTHLRGDWDSLLEPYGVPPEISDRAYARLVAAYSELGRHYHTLAHVADVLANINSLKEPVRQPAAVKLAAWFHDAVYDSRAHDNEERSAALAVATLQDMNLPSELLKTVERLVLLTKHHQAEATDEDGRLFIDSDLAILGAPPAQYENYADAIRREYAWVPEPAYRSGRTEVLSRFLQRPQIFHTDVIFAQREEQARRNMKEEIARLTTPHGHVAEGSDDD